MPNISSEPCEVVTSANAKSNEGKESLRPINPTTGDVQKSLEEKMKQERREFEMALNQKLKTSGLFTYLISFSLLFVKQSLICLDGILTPH